MTAGAAAGAPRHVLLTGMFDMDNYGDLLFPLVAAHRLAAHGMHLVPVAPTGARPALADAMPPQPLERLTAPDQPADAILVGGGYLIHASPLDLLQEYATDDRGQWAGPALWIGAALAAVMRGIPVAWNAPGVPHPFSRVQRPLLDGCLRACDYLSVRDTGSLEVLSPPADVRVQVVPDPIADLPRLWPLPQLGPAFAGFVARKGLAADARLLAVHVRNRSLAGLGAAGLAAALDAFCAARGLLPVLVAVGRSHNDAECAAEVAGHLCGAHLVYDDPLGLHEMTAVLAHSALYIGASLHGYVAARSYGVPGVLVAKPAYRKFEGFVAHAGWREDLARDWPGGLELAACRTPQARGPGVPASVSEALDRHWSRVADAVRAGPAHAGARLAFLRTYLETAIATQGASWLHRPLVHRVLGSAAPGVPSALAGLLAR